MFHFCRASGSFGSVQTANINNVSDILEDLIEGYDIRLRPKFGGKNCYNDKFTIDYMYIPNRPRTLLWDFSMYTVITHIHTM